MTGKNPEISIITVVLNGISYIEKTILSVIRQSCENIEYIIVDGGSEDGTLEIIKKYEDKISKWISEPDEGLYHAMNKGLRLATGDYVWFINGGDEVYGADTGSAILRFLRDFPDMLYGNTIIIDQKGKELGDRRLTPPEHMTWKSFKMGMLVCHQSLIVKKEIAPEFDLRYAFASDVDWAVRSMIASETIVNTHMYLSRFMEGGTTSRNLKKGLKERFWIMSKYYGFLPTAIRHIFFGFRLTRFFMKHKRF